MLKLKSIGELVRGMESDYQNGTTQISTYVSFNIKDNVDKIEAYLNSKHISGDTDSQGRDKPFFNIVTAAVNIWFRATDIDRKNIKFKAVKEGDYMLALLASIHLQQWMRKVNFGQFLNEWGRVLARYGSAVVKFVEKEGDLHPEVIPWGRIICDPIDFDNNVKVEKLYFTPAQLRNKKGYNQEIVEELLDSLTTRKGLGYTQEKDNKSEYIEVYEIHGEMPLSYLTKNEEDDETYVQQMYVLSFMATNAAKGEYTDYCLYSGRESSDPYMITHLIKEDGRTMAIGAVEHLFEAQWMMNHSIKQIKDQLDLASKVVFQTSDGNLVGRNVLSSIENGDILIYAQNQPLTMLNNKPDIASIQSFGQQWQSLGNQINGISEAMLGENPPSGSAWRQTQALLQESHSLFELMTENKGLHIEEMMRNKVIPHLKKKMDTTEEISATLEDYQIKQIDAKYVPAEAIKIHNNIIKHQILNGEIAQQPDLNALKQTVQEAQNAFGNQRFIKPHDIKTKTWKEVMKDFEWHVEVDVTGEATDRMAIMDTLNTALQVVANPNYALNDDAKMIVGAILNQTGVISPLQLSLNKSPMSPMMPAPQVGGVGAGMTPSMPTMTK